jgi:hypothetical protein
MLDEGLYSLDYKLADAETGRDFQGEALVAYRKGRILGSDCRGSVFDGSCAYDPVVRSSVVKARLQLPPDGELVTGHRTGPSGVVIEVACAFERPGPFSTSILELTGQRVALKLSYLGPLPP